MPNRSYDMVSRMWRHSDFMPMLEDGACVESDVDMFPMHTPEAEGRALAVCAVCPMSTLLRCREYAMRTNQQYGVWGGLTELQRKRLRRERRAVALAVDVG